MCSCGSNNIGQQGSGLRLLSLQIRWGQAKGVKRNNIGRVVMAQVLDRAAGGAVTVGLRSARIGLWARGPALAEDREHRGTDEQQCGDRVTIAALGKILKRVESQDGTQG